MGESEATRPAKGLSLGRPGWTMLVSGRTSSGAFELFEEVRETRGGPPPHVHRDRDETFYVVEGRYVFTRDHEEVELEEGESIFVPRGQRHCFRTLLEPSRTLIIIAPAGLESFFREMGTHLAAGATPLEAMTALASVHDAHPVE
jgi:mannose-6-phosphate isomerase-like protein (cupin superfamily)